MIESFSADLGGLSNLTEAERGLVRQAAALTLQAEALQGAVIRGEPVNPDELIRLTSEARRTLASIRKREKPKPPVLSEYLAGKRGAA